MMRRLFVIGGVAAGVLLAVAALLYYFGGGDRIDQQGQGFFARLKSGFGIVSRGLTPREMAEAPEFAFRRLEIDTTGRDAQACLVFTRPADASGRTHYEDYLSVDPGTRIVVRPLDTRLCIGGLAFNRTYTVTLKKGLPDRAGAKLSESETVPVELADKPALVRFSGGIILPRDNADGVPVTTVNIARLKIEIVRVGDRLLSQIETGVVDQTTMESWDETQLKNNQGVLVWSGAMDVAGARNDSTITLIPVRNILKDKPPGAYVLVASDAAGKAGAESADEDGGEKASQWVVDSDIGLTTFQGRNGIAVFARSYATARPLPGVKLTLVARDNNVLATATTNTQGRADFDPGFFKAAGGDEPVVVMAYGADRDFSFLDLRRPAFDLTDRGVGGRAAPGPIDGYLYTDRGVYRPGETVRAVALLRDAVGAALAAPVTLIATRPDGMEVSRTVVAGSALMAGSTAWSLPLNARAPHGRWQIAAYIDPKADAVGRVEFDVQDFVPQRLKVTLAPQEKLLHADSDLHVRAQARFLYGAPASGLSGEGEARIATDGKPFPAFSQYVFGRVDDSFSDVTVSLTVPTTDAGGATLATGAIGDLADTTLPLKAAIKISIHEPGGRTTEKTVDVPVRMRDVSLGLRPDFDDGSVGENAKAGFEAIAVNGDGKRIALSGLAYTWVREITNYQWYQDSGTWKYQSVTRDRLLTAGSFAIGSDAPARLAQAFPWGTYRLTVTDPKSGAASSYRFYSGWAASASGDRPDRIPVAADKPSYAVGAVAHVAIKPASDGQALIVVAGDRVFSSRLVDAPASGATIDIPVSADWGAGAYVLVTHYHPLDGATGREPVRAIGVTWLGIDNTPRTLAPLIGGPDRIAPRQHLTVPVTVKGLASGETAYLTLAAVDEGILQLTDFQSPDPVGYYFGKRRLGVGMHDDYGRLIRAEKAPIGALREGGDGLGGRSLAVVPTETVSLFSGLLKVGVGGLVQVPLDIPDFNGELRLMAVAISDGKIGRAERPLTVRDPVVADIVLPRFLAPNDKARAALVIDNVEGPAGSYTAVVTTSGPVGLDAGAPRDLLTRVIGHGQRVLLPVELDGEGLGVAHVALALTGPRGFKVRHVWPIEIRAPQLDVARDQIAVLRPGQSFAAGKSLAADLVPSTVTVALGVSAAHGYNDVPGLLKWLDKYPFGCIEQTTSRAMPLLYFNDLAGLAGLPKDRLLRARIQDSVDNVLDMQNFAGNFGMWGPGSDADPWLSDFALDFLEQAKNKGYVVPNEALRRGAGWLRTAAASDSNDDQVRAYAFYVLAKMGQANLSDLRYYSDTRGPEWNNAIAAALTGAAAAQAGDKSRAVYALGRARAILMAANPATYTTDDYGSFVRDLAATTALAIEGGDPEIVPALMKRTDDVDMRLNATTTQEKAWMLRAAWQLGFQHPPLDIVVNGNPVPARDGAVRLAPSLAQLDAGIALLNKGDAPVWRTVSVEGTPARDLPAEANGLTLRKTVWTMSGTPADLSAVRQNDRLMIVVEGQMANDFYRQMAVLDLLPAGLEIEMPVAGDDGKAYPWLDTLSDVTVEDARDDRFVAAFNIGSEYREKPDPKKPPAPPPTFRLAYIARAVTAGTFVMPAADASEMYAPSIQARTDMGTIAISAGQ